MHFYNYVHLFVRLARCTTRANVTFGHRCQFSGPRASQCPETCAARESFLNVVQNGTCCCCSCCCACGFPVLNTEGPLCDCKFDESNPNRAIWRGESAECYQSFWKGELLNRQTAMLMEYQGMLQFVGNYVQIRTILIAAVCLKIPCYKCSEEHQACPRGKQRADLRHCLSKMLRCTFCNIISSGSVCSTLVLLDRSKVQPGKLPPLLLSDVTRCASVELACPLSSVNRATWGSLSHATTALFSILCLIFVFVSCVLAVLSGVSIMRRHLLPVAQSPDQ